eukprot:729567_1
MVIQIKSKWNVSNMQYDGICVSGSRFISFNAQSTHRHARDDGNVHQLWHTDMRQVMIFCTGCQKTWLYLVKRLWIYIKAYKREQKEYMMLFRKGNKTWF